jgi:SAM-dependent methyltransferase
MAIEEARFPPARQRAHNASPTALYKLCSLALLPDIGILSMKDMHFATPMAVAGGSDCVFYHSMDLPISGSQEGHWDLRGRFDDYVSRISVNGKSVLDVGTATGFLSFEAEKRGAKVVSIDASTAMHWDRVPFIDSMHALDYAAWLDKAEKYLDDIKRSYWLAHRELKSANRVYYGNAYELPSELGKFDIVIVGQILVHLRDVVRALSSIAARCKDTLIIAEGMIENPEPVSHWLARAGHPENDYSFWHHSTGLYRELLSILGFELQSKESRKYRCNLEGPADGISITTLVFKRRQASPEAAT